jgi:carbon monoxide dehydrogenase subunit G
MTTIKKSNLINASIEQLEAVLTDAHRLPEWYPGVTAVDPSPGYPVEVGSNCKITYKAGGVTMDSKFTTIESIPQAKLIFQMDGMITGTNQWETVQEGSGTRVTVTINYEMAGGGLGKIADKLIVERMNEKNAATSLENLKAIVER